MEELIRRVEIADSLNWGHLADGHTPDCARRLHFTHHQTYTRTLRHFHIFTQNLCSGMRGNEGRVLGA